MTQDFDPVAYARTELAPALGALCTLASQDGAPDQEAFFRRVLRGIEAAGEVEDLAGPFMELSTSAFLGFRFSAQTSFLLDQVLEKAQLLSQSLALDGSELH